MILCETEYTMQEINHSNDQQLVLHSSGMEPRKLLIELMRLSGDNSNSLSVKLKGATTQPQIYKFVKDQVREPRRKTLQPIADHYGVPLDAFYDEELAEIEFNKLIGRLPEKVPTPKEDPNIKTVVVPSFEDERSRVNNMKEFSSRLTEAADGLMDDAIYQVLPRGWDLVREQSTGYHDFTVLDQMLRLVCGIEVKTFQQRGHRLTDSKRIDELMGFLWRNTVEKSLIREPLPMAVVVLLSNSEDPEEEVKVIPTELTKSLTLAVENGILLDFAIHGMKRRYHENRSYYDLSLYDMNYQYADRSFRPTLSSMMEKIRLQHTA